MDLGIAGRKAIVCASSKGLGRACAMALAEAGCELVLNGRDAETLAATAKTFASSFGVTVHEIAGDLDDPATREALIAAAPEADILVNNNGGPPFKTFGAITREDILAGRRIEHADPDRARPGAAARHGRSGSSGESSTSPRVRCARRSRASTCRRARARA